MIGWLGGIVVADSPAAARRRSEQQTFLIGEKLYLRPVELTDVATAPIWDPAPWPAPKEVVEERLKDQLQSTGHRGTRTLLLLICRRSDDQVVGSVNVQTFGWRFVEFGYAVDPLMHQDRQDEIMTEVLSILIPYHLDEQHMLSVYVTIPAGYPLHEARAFELGARWCYKMREKLFLRGTRRDEHCFEFCNPSMIEKLGAPREMQEGSVDREVSSPAGPSATPLPEEERKGALVVGERLYLRAFEPDEGTKVTEWMLQDPEIYYSSGRELFNPHAYGQAHVKIAKEVPPSWVRFAIVLRETDELIGALGLAEIDWVHRTAETETEIFRKAHRNAGYGTESKHLLLEYGFDRLGLHMVHSYVDGPNMRSAAALRKQGYRDCGWFGWDMFGPGEMRGSWVFDLLADEWRTARRPA